MQIIATIIFGTLALSVILQALGTRKPEMMRSFWIGLLIFDFAIIWVADWNALLKADHFISGPVTLAMELAFFAKLQFWLMKPPLTLVAKQYRFAGIVVVLVLCYVFGASLAFGCLALRLLAIPFERLDTPLMVCLNVSLFCWMAMQCGMYAVGRLFSRKWSRDQKLLFQLKPQGTISNYEEQIDSAPSR